MLIAVGLILFIGLILFHEWGHFVVARKNGVEVEEFGLFFPPRLKVLKKHKGTEYTLNLLPLGGFVKLKGENDADKRPGSFGAARLRVKAKIMLAGVFMNLIAAFGLFTILAWVGMPQLVPNQFTVPADTRVIQNEVLVGYVAENSPAAKVGLQSGDQLVAINGQTVTSAEELPHITEKHAGQSVTVQYRRDGMAHSQNAQLLSTQEVEASQNTDEPKGYFGISPTEYTMQRSTWSAPIVGAGLMVQFTDLTLRGLGTAIVSLFQGDTAKASEQVSGPVGIFVVLRDGTMLGIEFILLVVGLISLSLAIMNALPIPALDGGRLFILLVSRLFKKPLTPRVEEMVNGIGFMALLSLIVLITVVDVRRFF